MFHPLDIYQIQTNAPSVFHMPLQLRLNTTGPDTIVDIQVTASPQYAQFTVPDSVTSVDFDPNYRVLCLSDVYYGVEELVQDIPCYNDLRIGSSPSARPVITYVVNQPGPVRIELYDIAGRCQRTLYQGVRTAGVYTITVQDLPAGVYYCRMITPVNETVKKVVTVK